MSTHSSSSSNTHSLEPIRYVQNHGKTILVVEDEDSVREFVRMVLEHTGYIVVSATDGDLGLAEFVANPDRFALVISDVIMPNRSGPEMVEVIRGIRPNVPVIFMSAYTGGTSSNPINMPSGATVLEKPFSLDQLLHAVIQAFSQNVPRV